MTDKQINNIIFAKNLKKLKFNFNKRLRAHRSCIQTCLLERLCDLDIEYISKYHSINKEVERHCGACKVNQSQVEADKYYCI